jgi:hypothetical protein
MDSPNDIISLRKGQLTAWAEVCLRINHLQTLIQRELGSAPPARAAELSERSRVAAWALFNELVACGAAKPPGYTEPDSPRDGSRRKET